MKCDEKEKIRRLKYELLKTKWSVYYMKYVKIVVLALMEVIYELYDKKKK